MYWNTSISKGNRYGRSRRIFGIDCGLPSCPTKQETIRSFHVWIGGRFAEQHAESQ